MISRSKGVSLSFFLFIVVLLLISSCGLVGGGGVSFSTSDDTSGSLVIHTPGCCDGYTLVGQSTQTILIDMNGTVIHRWPSFFSQPAKMLPGGFIIAGSGFKFAGIGCGDFDALNEYAWNGSIVWSVHNWDDGRARQHHDFQREGNPVGYYAPGQDFLPHGNTLILAHYGIVNTSISRKPLKDDVIYEVDWNGSLTGFEWSALAHFNQFGFNAETKHGMYVNPGILGDGDIFHTNSMSLLGSNKWYDADPIKYSCFNPQNIIISSRHVNYIAIISRETGDIVWKVGPDFSKNTLEGRKLGQLIGLHHAHMIPQGLPGAGDILLFDNGGLAGYGYFGMPRYFRLYSRVIEFNPVTLDIVWQYSHRVLHWVIPRTGDDHKLYSVYMSSVQRLPNGNTLVSEATNGRVFEVTNTSKVVWEYATPTRAQQIYRAYRVPPEWVPGNPSGYAFWEGP